MKKILPGMLVVLVALGVWLAWITRSSPGLSHSEPANAALIACGEYLARVADCGACHTAIDGALYAGGLKIESPIGAIYSTNITPDKIVGIGDYDLADFDRAVRQGIRKDGKSLYPAMPYPSFARMSDTDIRALYAYFQHGVNAVSTRNKIEGIQWPLSMRWPLAIWRGLFAPTVNASPALPSSDPVLARGEYLVTGPGHCGACHTSRGAAMQEQALDDQAGRGFLAGGALIDHWQVPSLRGENRTGLGRWSEQDIVAFLKTGRTDHAAVFGAMADVVAWSTQYFSDADLQAVAHYLKSLPAADNGQDNYVYDDQAQSLLNSSKVAGDPGAGIYLNECAICHRNDGSGIPRMFPPLAGNPIVMNADPSSSINLILHGAALPPSNWAPSTVAMPPYANRLSDQQLADVVNFIQHSWGNQATDNKRSRKVTTANVAAWRRGVMPAQGGNAAGWQVMPPQPYGEGWTFSPQTHTGRDGAQ